MKLQIPLYLIEAAVSVFYFFGIGGLLFAFVEQRAATIVLGVALVLIPLLNFIPILRSAKGAVGVFTLHSMVFLLFVTR